MSTRIKSKEKSIIGFKGIAFSPSHRKNARMSTIFKISRFGDDASATFSYFVLTFSIEYIALYEICQIKHTIRDVFLI